MTGTPDRRPTLADLLAALDPDGAIRVRRRVQGEPPARPNSSRPDAPGVDGLPPLSRRIDRATKYLKKIPDAIDGGGGSKPTFLAARVLVHGFCLDEQTAFELLWTEYNPRCKPAWTEKELRHKVQDAANKPFSKPRGWVFANDRPER
ncbi:MAG TPA: hypothetical protein VD866_22250, partial [Urbifossiella sp.]|nr:hypothetical protein [Urbifossiella sp.]